VLSVIQRINNRALENRPGGAAVHEVGEGALHGRPLRDLAFDLAKPKLGHRSNATTVATWFAAQLDQLSSNFHVLGSA
jgi:hypothetical protein